MRNLVLVFGDKPRVRILEALLSLAPHEFTRGELAGDAGLTRRSGNRVFPEVEALGIVRKARGGSQPRFVVDGDSPVFRILQYLDHALELALDADAQAAPGTVGEAFRTHVADVVLKQEDEHNCPCLSLRDDFLPPPDEEYRLAHRLLGKQNDIDRRILVALVARPRTLAELEPLLSGGTKKNFAAALSRLRRDGLVDERMEARRSPPTSRYELTELGVLVVFRMNEMIAGRSIPENARRGAAAESG